MKELIITIAPNSALYHIYFEGGGELPQSLQGLFVRKRDAETVVTNYKEGRVAKASAPVKASKKPVSKKPKSDDK